jgi:hypothetical protein
MLPLRRRYPLKISIGSHMEIDQIDPIHPIALVDVPIDIVVVFEETYMGS